MSLSKTAKASANKIAFHAPLPQSLNVFSKSSANTSLIFTKASSTQVDSASLPVPEFIATFLETEIGATPLLRHADKVAWEILFQYQGVECSLALQKFGLRLRIAENTQKVSSAEVIKKLTKVSEWAEGAGGANFVSQQIAAGNVTIINRHHLLRRMVDFFEKKALDLGEGENPMVPSASVDAATDDGQETAGFIAILNGVIDHMNQDSQARQARLFFTLATLDAYFSWLEHVLVLLLPFTSFDPSKESLTAFIGDQWGKKYARVMGNTDPIASKLRGQLGDIKERLRNTFSHGGFEKNSGSLYIHNKFGAFPASLSGVVNSPFFSPFPMEPTALDETLKILREFDAHLDQRFPQGMDYVRSGLQLVFDSKSLSELRTQAANPSTFSAWLDKQAYCFDARQNMDL